MIGRNIRGSVHDWPTKCAGVLIIGRKLAPWLLSDASCGSSRESRGCGIDYLENMSHDCFLARADNRGNQRNVLKTRDLLIESWKDEEKI